MDVGHELHGVEVAPGSLLVMIVSAQLAPALRTLPSGLGRVLEPYIDPLLLHGELDPGDVPGRLQTQDSAVQLGISHPPIFRQRAPGSSSYPPNSQKRQKKRAPALCRSPFGWLW